MSKQIDERVVSMQFDNEDFEKKVSQTQNSIKKLNESLSTADGAKINEGLLRIGDTLDKLNSKFSAAGVAIATVVSKITSGIMDSVSKLSSSAIDSVITGGKNRALNLQKAQFAMEGILKDSEKVNLVMKDVNYGVADTAYSLDAAATVASSLVASGVSFAETMDEEDGTSLMARSLRAISGVAAQTGSEYSEIGHIFTTVAGQGKMMTMQLRQLEMRGFNAAATIADYFKETGIMADATEEDIREMVTQGKIDFETFAEAMDETFGSHAKDANKTFTGVMSNIKSAFAKIGAIFATPLLENEGPLVQFLDSVRALINDFKSVLAPLENVFRTLLTNILTPITNAFENIHTYFSDFQKLQEKVTGFYDAFGQYQGLIDDIWAGKWDNMYVRWNKLAEAGYELSEINWVQHLVNASEGVENHTVALANLTDEQLREIYFTEDEIAAFRELQSQCHETGEEFTDVLARMQEYGKYGGDLKTIFSNSFYKLGQGLRVVLEGIAQAFREIFGGDIVTKLYDMGVKFAELTDKIAYYDEAIGDVVITEKFAKLVENITSIFKVLLSVIKVIFTIVSTAGRIAFSILKKIFSVLIKGLASADLNGFADSVSEICNKIVDWIENNTALNAIIEFLGTALSTVIGWIKSAVKYVKESETLKTVISGISSVLSIIIGYITKVVSYIKEHEIIQKIIKGIYTVLSKVIGKITQVIAKVKEWFNNSENIRSSFSKIGGVIKTVISSAVEWIKTIVARIKEWYESSNIAQNAVQILKDIFEKVSGVIEKVTGKFKEWSEGLKDGTITIKDIIGNIISWVVDKVKNFVTKVIDILFELPGKVIEWISSLANGTKSIQDVFTDIASWISEKLNLTEAGKNIVEGLIKGIGGALSTLWSKIIEMAQGIIEKFCDKLGIHSPSTVFAWIGENIIKGLINGIKEILPVVVDVFKELINRIKDVFSGFKFDLGSLLGVTAFVGGIIGIVNLVKQVKESVDLVKGFIEGATNFFNGFGAMSKAAAEAATNHSKFEILLGIAILIGVIAAAIYVLGNMDTAAFKQGVIAVAGITAVVVVIAFLAKALSTVNPEPKKMQSSFKDFAAAFAGIAFGMLMFGVALAIIAKVAENRRQLDTALELLGAFVLIVGALIAATKVMKDSKNLKNLGTYVLLVGVAFVAFAVAFKMITDNLDAKPEAAQKAIIMLAAFGAIVVGLIAATKLSKGDKTLVSLAKYMLAVGVTFIAMAACFAIITKVISNHQKSSEKALLVIAVFGAMIVGLIAMTKILKPNTIKTATNMLLGAAACFIAMGICFAIITGSIAKHPDAVLPALGVIAAFGAIIVGLIAATKLAGTGTVAAAALVILSVAALFAVLAAAMFVFQLLDPEKVGTSLAIIAVLMSLCAGIVAVTALAKDCKGTLIVLTIMIALLVGALVALTFLDQSKLQSSALAMTMIIGVMALLMVAAGIIGKFGPSVGKLAATLGLLVLVVAAIGAVLWVMTDVLGVNADAALLIAQAITTLMLAMIPMLLACAVVGTLGAAAFIGIGALVVLIAAMTGVMIGLSYLADLFEEGEMLSRLQESIPVLGAIGEGLGTFLGSFVAAFSEAVFSAITTMITSAADSLDYFATKINENFIPVMSNIDGSILEGVGSLAAALLILTGAELVNGLLGLVGIDLFAQLPEQFGHLAEGIMAFWDQIKGQNIDIGMVQNAADACLVMAQAAATIPNSGGLLGKIFGENDIDKFGEMMAKYAESVVAFADTIAESGKSKEEFEEAADIASSVGNVIAAFAKNVPNSGGLLGKIVGDNDIDKFGKMMEAYATSVVAFEETIAESGKTKDQFQEAADIAASVGEVIAAFADKVPNKGGLLEKIVGGNNIDEFGQMMAAYGSSVVSFTNKIASSGFSEADFRKVADVAVYVGEILTNLVNALPNEGGFFQEVFTGSKSLSSFGTQMTNVAQGICSFVREIGDTTISDTQVKTVDTVIGAVVAFADAMPDVTGGIFGVFTGTMGSFADDMEKVGSGIVAFIEAIQGTEFGGNINKVQNFAKVMSYVAEFTGYFDGVDLKKLSDIISNTNNLGALGTRLRQFMTNIQGMDTDLTYLETAKTVVTSLTDLAANMKGVDFSVFSSFTEYLNGAEDLTNLTSIISNIGSTSTDGVSDAAISAMEEYANAIIDGASKMEEAGVEVVAKFIEALETNMTAGKVSTPFEKALSVAKDAIWSKESDFYNLGYFLVSGFANGISQNAYLAETAAANMMNNVVNKMSSIPEINSPSKVTFGFGKFMDMGFANGMTKYSYLATNAAADVTQDTIDAFSDSTARIASIINSDIDTNPTITPVLDLSNVSSGAQRLNSILAMGSTIGMSASAQITAARMANRQNGNSDIVSAIQSLEGNLERPNTNSYTIDGITYDDGSAIGNAIGDLIGAIRMERRM